MINSWMCPWLNAVYGKNFADQDNADAAMEMLRKVIVQNELGGFTAEKYAEGSAYLEDRRAFAGLDASCSEAP
jgi:hypothetical protein